MPHKLSDFFPKEKSKEKQKSNIDFKFNIPNPTLDCNNHLEVKDIIDFLNNEHSINKKLELINFVHNRLKQLEYIINVINPDNPLLIDYNNDINYIYNSLRSL